MYFFLYIRCVSVIPFWEFKIDSIVDAPEGESSFLFFIIKKGL